MSTGAAAGAGFLARMPGGLLVFWCLCAALQGAAVLMATLAATGGGQRVAGWHLGFATAACLLLLPVAFVTVPQLRAERAVWLGRVAPRAAWQQALRDHRRALLLAWALLALPLALLRLVARPEGEAWGATLLAAAWPPALMAALLGLALATAAALARLLPAAWGALAGLALLVLVMPRADAGPPAAQAWLGLPGAGELAALGLLALLLGTGALTLHAVHLRLAQAPAALPLTPALLQPWRQRWQAFTERWRLVDGRQAGALAPILLSQLPTNLSNPDPTRHFLQAWGSSITPAHGMRLALLTALALVLLRGAVPHWRTLLAPGGTVRRHMGPRIVAATLASMAMFLGFLLAVLALVFTLLPFLPGVPWTRLPALALQYAPPLAADAVLAVALATWLRAAAGTLGRAVGFVAAVALLGLLGLATLTHIYSFDTVFRAVLAQRDGSYLAVQLGLAVVFTLLAQRAWRRMDLAPLLQRPPARPGEEND